MAIFVGSDAFLGLQCDEDTLEWGELGGIDRVLTRPDTPSFLMLPHIHDVNCAPVTQNIFWDAKIPG